MAAPSSYTPAGYIVVKLLFYFSLIQDTIDIHTKQMGLYYDISEKIMVYTPIHCYLANFIDILCYAYMC